MDESEVLECSAIEQAALLVQGRLSSEELVRLYLARIERHNPRLSAFVEVFPRRALAAARKKDAERKRARGPLPPFHGVPIGIKDLNIVRWTRTRFGSRAMPHFVLPTDDHTVAPLRRAGFVILGKLATSEVGAMPVTEPDIHPPTRNPWALGHSAGGSSGGSAAAVAALLLPVAQGSDGGGSIRIPSAFCHLFGVKPSRGRLRNQAGLADHHILYTSGPITRTVDDAALMLDVMAGILEGRPHWAPPPPSLFSQLARARPRPQKIVFTTHSPLGPTDPEIAAAVERAARLLAELGHEVAPAGQLPEFTLEEFLPLWQHQIASTPFLRLGRAQPITRWLGEAGRGFRHKDIDALLDKLSARAEATLNHADLWLTPTVAELPPAVGSYREQPPSAAFAAAGRLGAFTAICNVTGRPAVSVPLGFSAAGLPMGMQLMGRLYTEGDLLAVARQLEEAMPWRDRRPSGFD
ncbi:MAG TPA: amidase [Polyangiales bacterium]